MIRRYTLVLVVVAATLPPLPVRAIEIVKSGHPVATIVIPDDPLAVVTAAAEELQYHVRKASEARLEIVRETDAANRGTKVFLGATRAAAKAGLRVRNAAPNAFTIQAIGQSLFILGDDSSGPVYGILHNNRTRVGTLFGVYEFVERHLGARWLWPGELGTVVPATRHIVVENCDQTGRPVFVHTRWRDGGAQLTGPDGWSSPQAQAAYLREQSIWLRRHRFAMGVNMDMAHSFTDWWDRFAKDHSEYFNLLPDGTRRSDSLYHGGHKTLISMSVGEPALWRQKVADWLARRSAQAPYIDASENDTEGKCVCAKCLAMDVPDGGSTVPWENRVAVARERFAKGDPQWASALGSLSDRYARYYLGVQKEAEKFDPQAVVMGYSYANYVKPPRNTRLNDRIVIGIVPDLMYPWTTAKRDSYRTQWDGWAATGAKMFLRPNYTLDGHNLPIYVARKLGEDFSYAAAHGLLGTDFDSLTGQWASQGPNLYMLARLHHAPGLTVERVLDEYYSAFGPAAEAVRAYFAHGERVSDAVTEDLAQEAGLHWSFFYRDADQIFTPQAMAAGRALLKRAESAAAHDCTAKARVTFLDQGLKNAELTLAVQRAFRKFKQEGDIAQYALAIQELDDFRARVEGQCVANMAYLHGAEQRTWDRSLIQRMATPGIRLDDPWAFAWDPKDEGLSRGWFAQQLDVSAWLAADTFHSWKDQEVGKAWKAEHGADYNGLAWYRKTFNLPGTDASGRVRLLFGKVNGDCLVWVNGVKVLERRQPSSDATKPRQEAFEVDVTNVVRWGQPNTLALRAQSRAQAGGISRPVWLAVSEAPLKAELNRVPNGGFEQGETGWRQNAMCGQFAFAIDRTDRVDGQASARLTCIATAPKDAEAKLATRAWARWYRTDVPVEKGKPHNFRVWLKTSPDFAGRVVVFLIPDKKEKTRSATMLNTGGVWRELTVADFVPMETHASIYLNVYDAPGTVWFDDVELTPRP